jgi:hypothetical protein
LCGKERKLLILVLESGQLGEVIGVVNAGHNLRIGRDFFQNAAESGFDGFVPKHSLAERKKRRIGKAPVQVFDGINR